MPNLEKHYIIQYRNRSDGAWLDDQGELNIPTAARASERLQQLRATPSIWVFRCIEVVTTREVCSWSVETPKEEPV